MGQRQMEREEDLACSIKNRRTKAISFAFEMGSDDTVAPWLGRLPWREGRTPAEGS